MTKYIPASPGFTDERATHITVEIYYDKGGFNPFSGNDEQRGIRLLVGPVRKENGSIRQIVGGGSSRRLLLKTLTRKNAAVLERYEKIGETNAESIAAAFERKDWNTIRNIFAV